MPVKRVLIILADGFEEIEAITPFDILKRAGLDVVLAGLSSREIKSARGAKFVTEKTLSGIKGVFDALILPGGAAGADNLAKSEELTSLIKKTHEEGRIIAAICASPAVVLVSTGVLKGKKATCYPGMEKEFSQDIKYANEPVVSDGNIVTSRGPATASEFGFKLAEILAGKEKAQSVREEMLF